MSTVDFAAALKHLCTLLGIAPGGSLSFSWFGDPGSNTRSSVIDHPDEVSGIVAALGGQPPPSEPKPDAGLSWLVATTSGGVQGGAGIAWKQFIPDPPPGTPSKASKVSFGVGGTLTLQSKASLVLNGWLFDVNNAAVSFTPAADLTATVPSLADFLCVALQLNLNKADGLATSTLKLGPPNDKQKTFAVSTNYAAWDAVRLATWIATTWLRGKQDGLLGRINTHLLPMLGATPDGMPPLPPFQDPGIGPDFATWLKALKPNFDDGKLSAPQLSNFIGHAWSLFSGADGKPAATKSLTRDMPKGEVIPSSVWIRLGPKTDGTPILGRAAAEQNRTTALLGADKDGIYVWPATLADPVQFLHIDFEGGKLLTLAAHADTIKSDYLTTSMNDTAGWLLLSLPDQQSFALASKGNELALQLTLGTTPIRLSLVSPKPLSITVGKTVIDLSSLPEKTPQPSDIAKTIASLLKIVAAFAPEDSIEGHWLKDLAPIVSAIANPTAPTAADIFGIVQLVCSAVSANTVSVDDSKNPMLSLDLGSGLKLSLSAGQKPNLTVELDRTLGADEELAGLDFHVGRVVASLSAPLDGNFVSGLSPSLTLSDMRVTPSGGSALASSFMPDFQRLKGADLTVKWINNQLDVSGGVRIAVEEQVGPVALHTLNIAASKEKLDVNLDADVSLAGIRVAPRGLGVGIPFKGGTPDFELQGLGLDADLHGIRLAGAFAKAGDDYVGTALVTVFDSFSLSAIGGYGLMENQDPSLFIFASLKAPLGGPPYFFITGIAGGFGYNRLLPPLTPDVIDHPFMKVMRGDIDLDPGPLATAFARGPGAFWVAAGIEFTSFAFIDGKLLAAVAFHPFSIDLMGLFGFGIAHIAQFELAFGISVNDERLLVTAGLTRNSYLIDPALFGLSGQFGLGVWYGGENAGDFVLSIGGYHPLYPPRPHYPSLQRVELHASLGPVRFNASSFFAITSREVTCGSSLSLSGEFCGISAGLDVYVDVYIRWDPFFLHGRMGIAVWFVFFGRHEISVALEIYTPEFGGIATIDLWLVSFEVKFGAELTDKPTHITAGEFVERQLRLPAVSKSPSGNQVQVAPFTQNNSAGLFRVDVGWGRASAKPKNAEEQDGLAGAPPIFVNSEFGLVVRSRLPVLAYPGQSLDPCAPDGPSGYLDLPLCETAGNKASLTVTVSRRTPNAQGQLGDAVQVLPPPPFSDPKTPKPSHKPLFRKFPAAMYGAQFAGVDADAPRSQIPRTAAADATVDGLEGVAIEFKANLAVDPDANVPVVMKQDKKAQVNLPLPLKPAPLAGANAGRGKIHYVGGRTYKRRPLQINFGVPITVAPVPPVVAPLRYYDAALPQVRRARSVGTTTAPGVTALADGTPVVPVPTSPARRKELALVTLRIVPTRKASSAQPARLQQRLVRVPSAALPQILNRTPVSLPQAAGGLAVAPGRALLVELSSDNRPANGVLNLDAGVRAIFLSAYGSVTGDVQVRTAMRVPVPAQSERAVIIHEGRAPQFPPLGREPMGVEAGTMALALQRRTFAAYGCTMEIKSGFDVAIPQLTAVQADQLLRRARQIAFGFQPLVRGTLVVIVRASARVPAPPQEQLSWLANGASLGALQVVTAADHAALLLPVDATAPWQLELSVGSDYRMEGVVALAHDVASVATQLARSAHWCFLDHAWTPVDASAPMLAPPAQNLMPKIHLELLP